MYKYEVLVFMRIVGPMYATMATDSGLQCSCSVSGNHTRFIKSPHSLNITVCTRQRIGSLHLHHDNHAIISNMVLGKKDMFIMVMQEI